MNFFIFQVAFYFKKISMSKNYRPVIKNLSDLREDVRTNDYMQWGEYCMNYRTKLDSIPFS